MQRIPVSQCCPKPYVECTHLEFLLANCPRAYGYCGHFFSHYPRACLQSHVRKLHLYLYQWKKFPSGHTSRHQGKPFQCTEIEGSNHRVPSPASLASDSSQKKVLFLRDYPITHPHLPNGEDGMVLPVWCSTPGTSCIQVIAPCRLTSSTPHLAA